MNKKIKISEIKKGIELSIENSFELINDAQILFENERYARAYSLSQLALEELGKSIMLFDFYQNLQADERKTFDFKSFRIKFRDHKWKSYESIFIELLMKADSKSPEFENVALENFKKIQKNKKGYFDNLKNQSLYVSLQNDKFKKPNELFKKEKVSKFINESKAKIEFSSEHTLKWLIMDVWLGTDKEGILTELKNKLDK